MGTKINRPRIARNTDKIVLNLAEKLLLWRRRVGINQAEAGKYFGISSFMYHKIEYGKHEIPEIIKESLSKIRIQLTSPERCFIYRKRCHKKQREIAKEMGCSRLWLRMMETGKAPCDELLGYWES